MSFRFLLVSCLCVLASSAMAQRGDRRDNQPQVLPANLKPTLSPPLTAEESIKTIKVPDGFHVELFASEPMVQDPVAITFDENGRMFVAEMRGFMPDVIGTGEDQPVARISVLEDTDGDGRADKATVFIDKIVMPRALTWAEGGLLYAANGKLIHAWDRDGDGKADESVIVDDRYWVGGNPEHQPNGLMRAIDNWYYNAKSAYRYRKVNGKWVKEKTEFRGQWGISQDNFGRLFYNVNDSQLRGDLIAPSYIGRNENYLSMAGLNLLVATNQRVYTLRMNTAINRGYRSGVLDAQGHALEFSGACSPYAYRGAQFPTESQQSVFVCDPGVNIVKRNVIIEDDMVLSSRFAYTNSEFVASTDERFRPVNLNCGPDGTLYVVDMYRGLVQHRIALTTFLRNETLSRGLDKPINLGRIYRVVYGSQPVKTPPPKLSSRPSSDLVPLLAHADGWWRDTAQRLLVERGDKSVDATLTEMALNNTNPIARVHALWTLEGLNIKATKTYLSALADQHSNVRMAAMRVIDSLAARGLEMRDPYAAAIATLADDSRREVKLQAVLTLGNSTNAAAFPVFARVLSSEVGDRIFRDAVISGLQSREADFVSYLLLNAGWINTNQTGMEILLRALASCVTWERNPDRVTKLLDLAASQADDAGKTVWRARALLEGMLEDTGGYSFRAIGLPAKPAALDTLLASKDSDFHGRVEKVKSILTWPGVAAPTESSRKVEPLSAENQKRFDQGKLLYSVICGACHAPDGKGLPALAPPLAGSEWVLGSEQRLVSIVLGGVEGPVTVMGKKYEPPLTLKDMPSLIVLNDDQVAAMVTYVRREWGHTADPVLPHTVATIRKQVDQRRAQFTEEELLKLE